MVTYSMSDHYNTEFPLSNKFGSPDFNLELFCCFFVVAFPDLSNYLGKYNTVINERDYSCQRVVINRSNLDLDIVIVYFYKK